ncbi:biotin carboxyl carrier protein [Rhizobiales bacterium GAS191]|jgi:acetyl-CoA carboxylase biotin carboxyl carrier protein|nr:biotin carboxyl carrier protein [Rhizobiales bacterium GAS191]
MELHEIKAFIDAMASSDLTELEVSKDGWTLRLVRGGDKSPAAPPARKATPTQQRPRGEVPQAATSASSTEIRAPLSGIVHLRTSPDAPLLVVPGQIVKAGAPVCVVEAMKTFNEVIAERDGIIEAVHVACGAEVEVGQPLMRIA